MSEDKDWQNARIKGKKQFVIIDSLYTAFFYVLTYILMSVASNYYRGKFSSPISLSEIVIDYIIEGIFWLIIAWIGIGFFRLIIWQKQENR